MNQLERIARRVRHSALLKRAEPLWDVVRPAYESFLSTLYPRGLERVVNGTDRIVVSSRLREVPESYEPDVWRRFTSELRPGDVVADVGAYVGLFAVVAARRVGPAGHVHAFEPNPVVLATLRDQLQRNGSTNVTVVDAAVTSETGSRLMHLQASESHLASDGTTGNLTTVRATTLDEHFSSSRVDVLKIDVEGYEEDVLRGGMRLLRDRQRGPRAIFIEVHPFAWPAAGTSSDALLGRLADAGYTAQTVSGEAVREITKYGEIVAIRG